MWRTYLHAAAACVAAATAVAAAASVLAALNRHGSLHAILLRIQKQLEEHACSGGDDAALAEPALRHGQSRYGRCLPLCSASELLTWAPPPVSSGGDPCVSRAPLEAPGAAAEEGDAARPWLLVCHDLKGGYLEGDVSPDGSTDSRAYRMWHWHCVDAFVYFSHHLVTIPPVGWIEAAHRHRVKVLGTLITEGAHGRRQCAQLFGSAAAADASAAALAAVARHLGFEGWLINIENRLTRSQVGHAMRFLHALRNAMRAVSPHSLVLWYDAVTVWGRLKHQNDLTDANRPFFDAAGALFVNYWWDAATPTRAAAAAAGRGGAANVFLGVDVHGRGTYGGGGDASRVALAAAQAAGCSAALFAPGWVYENHPAEGFEDRQQEWWEAVHAVWGRERCVHRGLPLRTSFNKGAGTAEFVAGACVSHQPWHSMRRQQLLPCLARSQAMRLDLCTDTAFEGGSSLRVHLPPSWEAHHPTAPLHLFRVHLPLPPGGVHISFTWACPQPAALGLVLWLDDAPPGPSASSAADGRHDVSRSFRNTNTTAGSSDGNALPRGSRPVLLLAPDGWLGQQARRRASLPAQWLLVPMQQRGTPTPMCHVPSSSSGAQAATAAAAHSTQHCAGAREGGERASRARNGRGSCAGRRASSAVRRLSWQTWGAHVTLAPGTICAVGLHLLWGCPAAAAAGGGKPTLLPNLAEKENSSSGCGSPPDGSSSACAFVGQLEITE